MTLGPMEYIVIAFDGPRFDGSIADELARVVDNGTIRIVDAVLLAKDDAGDLTVLEIDAKEDPRFETIAPLLQGRMGLFTPEDLTTIAAGLPAATAALVMLFEHRWSVRVKEAVQRANGRLIGRAVIPPEILEEAAEELEAHARAVEAQAANVA